MSSDAFNDIKIRFDIALARWQQGDLIGAYDALQQLLIDRLDQEQLLDADVKIIQSLAELTSLFGDYQATDALLQSAIELYQHANNIHWADYTRLRFLQLLLDRGKLHQAKNILSYLAPRIGNIDAIEISSIGLVQWEMTCQWSRETDTWTILWTELYLALGRLLSALGQYGDALVMLQRGLLQATQEDCPTLAQQTQLPLRLTIIAVHLEKGDLSIAQAQLDELSQNSKLEQPEHRIRWYELSGKLHLLRGEFGDALVQLRQVQVTCQDLKLHASSVRSTLNLAHSLILLNQTSTARQYLTEALEDAMVLEDASLVDRATLLIELAQTRNCSLTFGTPVGLSVSQMRRSINDARPIRINSKPIARSPQSPNYLTWFEDRALTFQWQLSNFELKMAAALLNHLEKVFQVTDSRLIQTRLRILRGMILYYESIQTGSAQSLLQAAEHLRAVCPTLKEIDLKPELWQTQRILGWCYTRLKVSSPEQEALTESTNQLLTQLTESLSPKEQAMYLLNKWTSDEEYIADQINRLQGLQTRLTQSPLWLRPWRRLKLLRRINHLVEHLDRYKDVLAKRTLQGRKLSVPLLRPAAVWRKLLTYPKDRVTLTFLVLPDRVLIVRSGRFLLDFRVIAATRLTIRNLVQSCHKHLQQSKGNRDLSSSPEDFTELVDDNIPTLANTIAEILEIPQLLQDLPSRIRSLTIVPDDILHGFPFASIRYQNKYLIEDYALSLTYESKTVPSRSIRTQTALAIGVSHGDAQFKPLPGVKRELDSLTCWLTQYKIKVLKLEDARANKAAIIQQLSQAHLLHIACHGIFEPDRPDHSGLVLFPHTHQRQLLSLRELSEIDLTNLHHATLSSCWSADHFILPGRWIISLPETLWRSGADSILGCLWEVDDQGAIAFMTHFYDFLARFPRDEALRLTQLACIQGELGSAAENPRFWSGFTLYGNPKTLKL